MAATEIQNSNGQPIMVIETKLWSAVRKRMLSKSIKFRSVGRKVVRMLPPDWPGQETTDEDRL